MPLAAGSRIGPYEVLSPLGAGGMGEVFLARDPRLGREVAIKALPEAFAHDPERLARFEREARVLASLKHPNIAGIHGLEEADGHRYLILEYVPGPTLADRLRDGPLALDETLDVCAQIAAGVEAAHESGVIHRDLKPANVKLTPAGEVKVLDFGLAKGGAGTGSSSGLDLSNSPTIAHQATTVGVILGTAAYMSPEQARGRAVDRRTDIWSFGCVLYECLTRKPLHQGETVSDVIARILEREPDWSALPANTPPRVRALLARCLRKDPRERLRDIGDARLELAEIRAGGGAGERAAAAAAVTAPPSRTRERALWALATLLLIAATALLAPRLARRQPVLHLTFSIEPPPGQQLVNYNTTYAISPDGASVALIASDTTGTARIWLRPLSALKYQSIEGTENALELFWSPDSRQIGFFADNKLCTIPIQGGTRQVLADAPDSRGGTWGRKGRIVFAPLATGPLMSVAADGGDVTVAGRPDSSRNETALRFPWFLPDGEHFTCVALPRRAGGEHDVLLGSLGSPRRRLLFRAPGAPIYAPPGVLLYTRRGQLVAQRCDSHGGLSGKPSAIGAAPDVTGPVGTICLTASETGVLLYAAPPPNTRLLWFDPDGGMGGRLPMPPGRWASIRIAPDGRRAVVERVNDPLFAELFMVDLERGIANRLVSSSELAGIDSPVWSSDGSRLVFSSHQTGTGDLYVKRADGAGRPELLYHGPALFKTPNSFSPDDRLLTFQQPSPGTGWDVWALPMEGDRKPYPLIQTAANENGGWISPDGRLIAFSSDESGRAEIYVAPFPACSPRVQVSTSGAIGVVWRDNSRQVMLYNPDGYIRTADIEPGPPLHVSVPRLVFRLPPGTVDGGITRDFRRGLVSVPVEDAPATVLTVETGWWRK